MATVTKPFWWNSFAQFYGFANDPGTTIDSAELLSRLNTYLYPAPSDYQDHLADTQDVTTTGRQDLVVLGNSHDFIAMQGGLDYIAGRGGDDVLYGEAGADIFSGGAGRDLIVGNAEGDTTKDRDIASYLDAASGISVQMATQISYVSDDGNGSYDMLYGIEDIMGSRGADDMTGSAAANRLFGSRGSDTIYGGGGNDTLYGGADADALYGDAGNDIFNAGKGRDTLHMGAGADRIIVDAGIGANIASHADIVYDFQTGSGGDKVDVSDILYGNGYRGTNAVADGYVRLRQEGADLVIELDLNGGASGGAQELMTLKGVAAADFSTTYNLVTAGKDILYAPILGQSNAKGLSVGGEDNESGVTRLKSGLGVVSDYDEVVSMIREAEGTKQSIDIAVGGTTVDGNRNTSYTPDNIWWYPDSGTPGEVLIRAVNILAGQFADLRATGTVKPVVIWGQGEAEARMMGMQSNADAASARYINATLAVFDYIKAELGDDIEFYIMQTGRLQEQGIRNAGVSQTGINQTIAGLALVQEAQVDMALMRDDVHLAAVYGDLQMLYEADPVKYRTDYWHTDYEEREIIGDRLAAFIAADMGFRHVISNPGDYPVRALADLNIVVADGGGTTTPPTTPPAPSHTVTGTSGDDRLTGAATGSLIDGQAGADKIIATGGTNILIGGLGKDSISCAAGQDTVVWGANLVADLANNADYISKFTAGAGGDILDVRGLMEAAGYTGSNPVADGYIRVTGDGANTKIYFDINGPGGTGFKYIGTLAGVNAADFSIEHNLLFRDSSSPSPTGGNGVTIAGGGSEDLMIGTTGDDTISGGGGSDTIVGAAGRDMITGGTGRDNFVFETSVWDEMVASGQMLGDVISDFLTGGSGDSLDVSILLEKAGFTGADAVASGHVRIAASGADTIVSFDRDGTAGSLGAEVLVTLKGVAAGAFEPADNLRI